MNHKNTKLYFLLGVKEVNTMVSKTEKSMKTKIVIEGKHNEAFSRTEFLEVITF